MAISNVKGTLFQKVNGSIVKMLPETVDSQVNVSLYKGVNTYDLASVIADVEARLNARENIDVFQFKGGVSAANPLPASDYEIGWAYRVTEAGTYAGQVCEQGDTIYCQATAGTDDDWLVVQANIDGAVTGPAASVMNNIAVFDGVSGKVVKDSGYNLTKFDNLDADIAATNTRVTALETALGDGGDISGRLTQAEADIDALETAHSDYETANDARVQAVEDEIDAINAKLHITVAADAEEATLTAAATNLVDNGLIIVHTA